MKSRRDVKIPADILEPVVKLAQGHLWSSGYHLNTKLAVQKWLNDLRKDGVIK